MTIRDLLGAVSRHEYVAFGSDQEAGLRAIIAVHSTVLGPALGGTRFYPYSSEENALEDALRLSWAMTLKAAAAGVPLGGGKTVIIGDPGRDKNERLLRAYGRLVDGLGGRYITAEDIGTTVEDMTVVRGETRWVSGLPLEMGGSGDPSPATARGVMHAMRAVAFYLWRSTELSGKRVVVQGVGKVGSALVGELIGHGCDVAVADTEEGPVDRLARRFGVGRVPVEEALFAECDILAPCAVGGVLSADTIPFLQCRAVVGAANNQLATDQDAVSLAARGILYAPDFVVNAGGLINISEEPKGYSGERARRRVEQIYETMLEVLASAERLGVTPNEAALRFAQHRLAQGQTASSAHRRTGGQASALPGRLRTD